MRRPAAVAALAGDRGWLFGCIGLVTALNGFAGTLVTTLSKHTLADALLNLGGISAIVWVGIAALPILGARPGSRGRATAGDISIALLMLALALVPFNQASSVGLLIGGAYLFRTSPADTNGRRIAVVMLALTGPLIWGRLLLAMVGPRLLGIDAAIAAQFAQLPVRGNMIWFADGSGVLYVALGCSSVHNISLALLLFVTLLQLLELPLTRGRLLVAGLAAAAMALVNVLRLAAMARFPAQFDYLHTGEGGQIFGMVGFMAAGSVALVGILLSARDAERRTGHSGARRDDRAEARGGSPRRAARSREAERRSAAKA